MVPRRSENNRSAGCAWAGAVLAVLLVALSFVLPARPVAAHAHLLSSEPASGTALAALPAQFVLRFSEPLQPEYVSVSLLASDGREVGLGTPLVPPTDPFRLIVPVGDPASASPGNYTLVFRIVSAADGHSTNGTIAISAGTGVAPTFGGEGVARPPWWRLAIEWMQLGGLLLLTGLFIFGVAVALPTGIATASFRRAQWQVARAAGLVFLAGLILALLDLGVQATGETWAGFQTYRDVIFDSSVGRAWLARFVIGLALVALAAEATREDAPEWVWWLGLADGAAALLTLSVAGHAGAVDPRLPAVLADWAHAVAIATWLGGLVALLVAIRSSSSDAAAATARATDRFGWIALPAVVVVVATGFISASYHVAGPESLRDADYGKTLVGKHLLLLPMLVAGGLNALVVRPRLRAAVAGGSLEQVGSALRSLGRVVAAEAVIGGFVLLAAAALTELPPANAPLPVTVAGKATVIEQTTSAGDLTVRLRGRLAGDPGDQLVVTVADANGNVPADLQRVIVSTAILMDGVALGDRFDAEQVPDLAGSYAIPATRLGLSGKWDLSVTVRRAGVQDVSGVLSVDTSAVAIVPPRLVADVWRLPRVTLPALGLALAALAVLIGGLVFLRRMPGLEPFAGGIVLLMVVLIATGFAIQSLRWTVPVRADSERVNPMTIDDGTLVRAETLYATYCVACHGVDGKGVERDDPVHRHGSGVNLLSRRALAQTDGDLFSVISRGLPGTSMPAYDQALTPEERWELVIYLRALQDGDKP